MREGAVQWHVRQGADKKAIEKKLEAPATRGVTVQALVWSEDGKQLALQLRAIDNKDRWLATVDLATRKLVVQHRLTDPAWINWDFNEFGWLRDSRTPCGSCPRRPAIRTSTCATWRSTGPEQLTRGEFEVSAPVVRPTDGSTSSPGSWPTPSIPGRYEVYRVAVDGRHAQDAHHQHRRSRSEHLRGNRRWRAGPFVLSFARRIETAVPPRQGDHCRPDLWVQDATSRVPTARSN